MVTKALTLEKGQNWIQIAARYSLAAGIWPAEPFTLCEPLRVQLSNVYNILGTHGINFSSKDVLVAILSLLSLQSKLSYNLVQQLMVIHITIPQESWRMAGHLWFLPESYLSMRRRRSIFWIFFSMSKISK